jgi:hypothetical protein
MSCREPRHAYGLDRATLARLRAMPSEDALSLLAVYLKADRDYRPIKNPTSRRWHVHTKRGEFEILTTGSKWYDTRARKGGGGAIDLVMHAEALTFVDAVSYLRQRAHSCG